MTVDGTGNKYTVQVEKHHGGQPQLLTILQPLSASWFDMSHFENNCNDPFDRVGEDSDDEGVLNYNKNQHYSAREEIIKAARPVKSINDTFVVK